ncbi:MAG: type II secretion system minor pseudopilin GspJ [Pseudomonadota bacterium]
MLSSKAAIGQAPRAQGFTLAELLVSLVIFTVISLFLVRSFDVTERGVRRVQEELDALLRLQRTMQTLTNDISQIQPRPVRDPVGTTLRAPLLADTRNAYFIELTRGGHANPLGVPRPTAQRIGYRFEDGEIVRAFWPVLDNVLATEPQEIVLFEELERFEVRFLDVSGNWVNQWPQGGGGTPRAVEIVVEHPKWGEIMRVIEVGG